MPVPERSSDNHESGPRVHRMRRCPNCGGVTERFGHCFTKGHPMFPQTDDDFTTEPCEVVSVPDLVAWLDAGGIEKLSGLGPRPRRVAELIAREFNAS